MWVYELNLAAEIVFRTVNTPLLLGHPLADERTLQAK